MADNHIPSIEPPDMFVVKRSWAPRGLLWMAIVFLALATLGMWLQFRPLVFEPGRWQSSGGFDRGRMLKSLLAQSDFVDYTRAEVQVYLGGADYDERLAWYDLGVDTSGTPVDPRADVGEPGHISGVFRHDRGGIILSVLYSRRRPMMGSTPFDSAAWFGNDHTARRTMFTNALGILRRRGLTMRNVIDLLGPPDGSRTRAQYDVGYAGAFFGTKKALILEYDANDVVIASHVTP